MERPDEIIPWRQSQRAEEHEGERVCATCGAWDQFSERALATCRLTEGLCRRDPARVVHYDEEIEAVTTAWPTTPEWEACLRWLSWEELVAQLVPETPAPH